MQKDVYTVKDIAGQLQVKEKSIRNLIASGQLPAEKVCGKWVISANSFQNLIEGRRKLNENYCDM